MRLADGRAEAFETRLLGRWNLSNILAGLAAATECGRAASRDARRPCRPWPPRPGGWRSRKSGGIVRILDVANANPRGAEMALEVLAQFKGGARILITPGMVELGPIEAEENRALRRAGGGRVRLRGPGGAGADPADPARARRCAGSRRSGSSPPGRPTRWRICWRASSGRETPSSTRTAFRTPISRWHHEARGTHLRQPIGRARDFRHHGQQGLSRPSRQARASTRRSRSTSTRRGRGWPAGR